MRERIFHDARKKYEVRIWTRNWTEKRDSVIYERENVLTNRQKLLKKIG